MSLRVFARLFTVLIIALSLLSPALAAPTPTPEQIEQFKKLSPTEQQALAKQFGIDPAMLKAATGTTGATNAAKRVDATPPPPIPDTAPQPRATAQPDLNAPVDTVSPALSPDTAKLQDKPEAKGTQNELKPFGYSLFAGTPSTFAPATDIPVPLNYVIGPGDTFIVQLYGKQSANYELDVDREGIVRFPDLGPISAAGQTFDEFKAALNKEISEKIIGVKASITMGALRSIRVFVMGEAFRPGSYTVSSLSTITNALFASGGVTPIGSLRSIQLKRKGEVINTIDLYDLLLKGDTGNDTRLLPGDVIFIPPVGKTVGVAGEVRRPAIYEIKGETNFKQLVALAGGTLPSAYPEGSRIERIDARGNRTMVDVNLNNERAARISPRDGDLLTVASILDKMENVVLLSGHVQRPGGYEWKRGMHLSELVTGMQTLLPKPDLDYAIVKRETPPTRSIEVIQVRLGEVIRDPHGTQDIRLQNRDEVIVFGKYSGQRMASLAPVTEQLRAQTAYGVPAPLITLAGNVRYPGTYPLTPGLKVADLVRIGDLGLQPDLNYALIRREEQPSRRIQVIPVQLGKALAGDAQHNMTLTATDTLMVFGLAANNRQELIKPLLEQLQIQSGPGAPTPVVNVSGDVRFGGSYPLTPYMKVADLIAAAGGFTESAYGIDAEVSRTIVNDTQFATFNRIDVVFGGQNRRVSDENLLLMSRDQLHIKRVPNWAEQEFAEVLGEVNFPGRYPIYKGDTLKDLVKRAGGLSTHANPKGAIFLREELRVREQDQLDKMRDRLTRDLAALQIEIGKEAKKGLETEAVGTSLLDQATGAKATGRLSIDLQGILAGTSDLSVMVRDGDRLVIPRPTEEVTVLGEVQYPTSHMFHNGKSVEDYIGLSGGVTDRSDDSRTYVIKANGEIIAAGEVGTLPWHNTRLEAGDTIVVPYDVYQVSPLTYWQTVSQILFNISTTVAALKTVGVYQ